MERWEKRRKGKIGKEGGREGEGIWDYNPVKHQVNSWSGHPQKENEGKKKRERERDNEGEDQVDNSCLKDRWKYHLIALAGPCVPPNPSIHLSGTFSPGFCPDPNTAWLH